MQPLTLRQPQVLNEVIMVHPKVKFLWKHWTDVCFNPSLMFSTGNSHSLNAA